MRHLPKNVLTEIEQHADSLIYETRLVITEQLPETKRKHADMIKVNHISTLKPYFQKTKSRQEEF